jgi:hypothetical protein
MFEQLEHQRGQVSPRCIRRQEKRLFFEEELLEPEEVRESGKRDPIGEVSIETSGKEDETGD